MAVPALRLCGMDLCNYRIQKFAGDGTFLVKWGSYGSLSWLHIIVSNAKALIGGTYHGLGSRHLQAYLDEYDYRLTAGSGLT